MGFLRFLGGLFSFRWLKIFAPKSLYVRTILIIIIPTIITLSAATFVFFDRHWYTTTHRLTHAVAGDVSGLLYMMRVMNPAENKNELVEHVARQMDITVDFEPDKKLKRPLKRTWTPLRSIMHEALDERVPFPHSLEVRRKPSNIIVHVEAPEGVFSFTVPQRRVYTPTTEVFIGWMIGSSILLSAIALLFMRNQVRPVRRLAAAADAIGRGQDVPWFKLEGAIEVRQAASALMLLRDRIRRAMSQRTAMLAGVSHDMRTPLARMKLQLAMMPETSQTRGFQSDITDMEAMLEAYLAFARGEEAEPTVSTDIAALLEEIVISAKREYGEAVTLEPHPPLMLDVRPNALKRCVSNLVVNALRYGKVAHVSMTVRDKSLDILIDDEGPGIAPEKREEVFRPFFRLDASRNMDTGGVGLGLTIARDVARAHGGNLILETSPQGGLRARIWLPV